VSPQGRAQPKNRRKKKFARAPEVVQGRGVGEGVIPEPALPRLGHGVSGEHWAVFLQGW
jgi:hypothetical protein